MSQTGTTQAESKENVNDLCHSYLEAAIQHLEHQDLAEANNAFNKIDALIKKHDLGKQDGQQKVIEAYLKLREKLKPVLHQGTMILDGIKRCLIYLTLAKTHLQLKEFNESALAFENAIQLIKEHNLAHQKAIQQAIASYLKDFFKYPENQDPMGSVCAKIIEIFHFEILHLLREPSPFLVYLTVINNNLDSLQKVVKNISLEKLAAQLFWLRHQIHSFLKKSDFRLVLKIYTLHVIENTFTDRCIAEKKPTILFDYLNNSRNHLTIQEDKDHFKEQLSLAAKKMPIQEILQLNLNNFLISDEPTIQSPEQSMDMFVDGILNKITSWCCQSIEQATIEVRTNQLKESLTTLKEIYVFLNKLKLDIDEIDRSVYDYLKSFLYQEGAHTALPELLKILPKPKIILFCNHIFYSSSLHFVDNCLELLLKTESLLSPSALFGLEKETDRRPSLVLARLRERIKYFHTLDPKCVSHLIEKLHRLEEAFLEKCLKQKDFVRISKYLEIMEKNIFDDADKTHFLKIKNQLMTLHAPQFLESKSSTPKITPTTTESKDVKDPGHVTDVNTRPASPPRLSTLIGNSLPVVQRAILDASSFETCTEQNDQQQASWTDTVGNPSPGMRPG